MRIGKKASQVAGTINSNIRDQKYFGQKVGTNWYRMSDSSLWSSSTASTFTNPSIQYFGTTYTKTVNTNHGSTTPLGDICGNIFPSPGTDTNFDNVTTYPSNFGSTGSTGNTSARYQRGICRIYITTPAGSTATFKYNPTKPGGSQSYPVESEKEELFWIYRIDRDNNTMEFAYPDSNNNKTEDWSNMLRLDAFVENCDASNTVDVTIQLHDFTETNDFVFYNDMQIASSEINDWYGGHSPIRQSDDTPYYCVDDVFCVSPSRTVFKQRTGLSTYQYNVEYYPDHYYKEGLYTPTYTATAMFSDEVLPDCRWTGDSDYRTNGHLGYQYVNQMGTFRDDDDKSMVYRTVADTYIPYVDPIDVEDTFDTEDEWQSTAFEGGAKNWPDHIAPSGVSIDVLQPSSTTISQSGVKYVRRSGFARTQMEVTYPPMKGEDFRKFYSTAFAAKGQAIPFYFRLYQDNKYVVMDPMSVSAHPTAKLYVRGTYPTGDTKFLIAGFDSNLSKANQYGELWITNSLNGGISTSINEVDSNVYGEVEVRLGHPLWQQQYFGDFWYNTPYHVICTLNSDNFVYDRDLNGFYYLTVTFDLDYYK